MRQLFILLVLAGAAFADVSLQVGTCQTFTLFNATDNSTADALICAAPLNLNLTLNASDPAASSYSDPVANLTVQAVGNQSVTIENVTYYCPEVSVTMYANSSRNVNNVSILCLGNTTIQNVTTIVNVTNVTNVTYYCPQVSLTMFANATQTINNATVSCLQQNATVIYQNSTCGFSGTFNSSDTAQAFRDNAANVSITINPVPASWCYENRNENATAPAVFRSDRGNTTFICNAPQPAAAAPEGQPACTNATQYIYELTPDIQNLSCEHKTSVDICTDQITSQYEASLLLKGDGVGWVNTKIQDCNSTVNALQQSINDPVNGLNAQITKLQEQVKQNSTIQAGIDEGIDKKLSGPLFWGVALLLSAALLTLMIYLAVKMNERRRISASDFPEKTSDAVIDGLKNSGKGKWAAPGEVG